MGMNEVELILHDLDVPDNPSGRQVTLPPIQEHSWCHNNPYRALHPNSESDSENAEHRIHSIEEFPPLPDKPVTFKPPVNNYSYFIVDSGADDHMCNNKLLFTSLQAHPNVTHVTLGDGQTQRQCHGVGIIDIVIGHNTQVIIHHVLYVPTLKESLFSTLAHIQNMDCSLTSNHNTTHLTFGKVNVQTDVGTYIKLYVQRPQQVTIPIAFEATEFPPFLQTKPIPNTCRMATRSTPNLQASQPDTEQEVLVKIQCQQPLTTIVRAQPNGYGYVITTNKPIHLKPKTQTLVPTGLKLSLSPGVYSQATSPTTNFPSGIELITQQIKSNKHTVKLTLINSLSIPVTINPGDPIATVVFDKKSHNDFQPLAQPNTATMIQSPSTALMQNTADRPLVHPVDKVSSTVPKLVSFTPDILRRCVGFQRADSLISAFKECTQPTVTFPDIGKDPVVDLGEVSTVDRKK